MAARPSVRVVTTDGFPRNPQLLDAALAAEIVLGVDGRRPDFQIPDSIDQESNQVVLGRHLPPSHAAAVLSHQHAQASRRGEWLVILEDDAVIPDISVFNRAIDSLGTLRFQRPAVVLLHTGFGGVFGRTWSPDGWIAFAPVRSVPTGAVAYAMNAAASRMAASATKLVGVPDWPTWTAAVQFIAMVPAVVAHSENHVSYFAATATSNDSTAWPSHRSSVWLALLALGRPNVVRAYGGHGQYLRCVLIPGVWRRLSQLSSTRRKVRSKG